MLDGGAGKDNISATAPAFIAGGTGDDLITASGSAAVIAYNKGDGNDTLRSSATKTTLSLGAGTSFQDLALHKNGNSLVVDLGAGSSVTLDGWYDQTVAKPQYLTLQVVAEAVAGFNGDGTDPLLSNRIESFDLKQLAGMFDAERAADPTIDRWSALHKLLNVQLAGSDTQAVGGDLARFYGNNGTLAGMAMSAAQNTLKDPGFGTTAQSLTALDQIAQSPIKLG
jgi:Ca2+-binding RTX toxin-like protein